MSANDLIGLSVTLLILLWAVYGLNRISRPSTLTQEEYEKRLREGSGIARGAMNAGFYAIQQWVNPKAAEAAAVQKDMREGHYESKQESGDDLDDEGAEQ
ncbi:MAG: hypothetical protein WCB68_12965 [Pyrinomonadaceae bacterium]